MGRAWVEEGSVYRDDSDGIEVIDARSGSRYRFPVGQTLGAMIETICPGADPVILGARVNNRLRDLYFRAYQPLTVEYVDIRSPEGIRMYTSSLFFLLQKSVRDLLPESRLQVQHAVSRGYYCEITGIGDAVPQDLIGRVKARMQELVERDLPFRSCVVLTRDAIGIFEEQCDNQKVRLLESRKKLYTTLNELDGLYDYYYEALVPSSGYLQLFDLVSYYDGMLLKVPDRFNPGELERVVPQPQMYEVIQEHKEWLSILGIEDAGTINRESRTPLRCSVLVKVAEALHEKKLSAIADQIVHGHGGGACRVVLIAGPSSSGKTTTSKRLAIQLMVNGMMPHVISMDNYFVDREKTPRDEHGEYDFESFDALDAAAFQRDVGRLLAGEEVELPKFSFQEGRRFYDGTRMRLGDKGILLIEGIHGLNPRLVEGMPTDQIFKLYLSALTSISLDGLNRISSSDNRLLRRLVRDYQYRSYSACDTIARWQSVRRGEERNIFPYQEYADVMFNTALPYEIGVLKGLAEPILQEVPDNVPQYSEAVRLLSFLEFFEPIPLQHVPGNSLLREFLGGSSFSYE